MEYPAELVTFVGVDSTGYASGYGWRGQAADDGYLYLQAMPDNPVAPQSLESDGALFAFIVEVQGLASAKGALVLRPSVTPAIPPSSG